MRLDELLINGTIFYDKNYKITLSYFKTKYKDYLITFLRFWISVQELDINK